MSKISMYIRHCTLYGFQLENNARAAAHHIYAALGVRVLFPCFLIILYLYSLPSLCIAPDPLFPIYIKTKSMSSPYRMPTYTRIFR